MRLASGLAAFSPMANFNSPAKDEAAIFPYVWESLISQSHQYAFPMTSSTAVETVLV